MSTPDEIERLIARVGLSDREAFKNLYRHTSAKLFGVCLRILQDRSEAEDALQEIYVKIWRNASTFGSTQYSPISWMVAIARNHSIDRIRARKPQSLDLENTLEIPDNALDPEASAMESSESRQIEDCLGELQAARADAIRGAYLDGYSYQELAERHDLPLNTVRTWLRRGLIKLKECLER